MDESGRVAPQCYWPQVLERYPAPLQSSSFLKMEDTETQPVVYEHAPAL